MAKEDKIVRFPRPLGTTAMILEYQKSGNPEDLIKVQNYLINQWLLGNGVLCGVTYDINSFSNRLGIDTEYVRIFMRDRLLSSKIWDRDKQEELLQALMRTTSMGFRRPYGNLSSIANIKRFPRRQIYSFYIC